MKILSLILLLTMLVSCGKKKTDGDDCLTQEQAVLKCMAEEIAKDPSRWLMPRYRTLCENSHPVKGYCYPNH